MSNWETIQDKSSHISPVKLTIQRDYSAERVDNMFEAVYRSSHMETTVHKLNKTNLNTVKKPNQLIKRLLRISTIVVLLAAVAFQWHCSNEPNEISICKYSLDIQPQESIKRLQMIKDDYVSKLDLSWPLDNAKEYYRSYMEPHVIWVKEYSYSLCEEFQNQLIRYVESGKPKSFYQDNAVHPNDRFKATAKRILEYFNKSSKSGMKQDEAREKAKEILNSLFLEKIDEIREAKQVPFVVGDSDAVAHEIQSIMKVAMEEKAELDEQLSIIQSNIQEGKFSQHDNRDDFVLFVDAVKDEIEGLRMKAENSVRNRTKLAILSTNSENPIVNRHIKEDLLSTQKAALKDLRQIYIKLYETNKMIDALSFTVDN